MPARRGSRRGVGGKLPWPEDYPGEAQQSALVVPRCSQASQVQHTMKRFFDCGRVLFGGRVAKGEEEAQCILDRLLNLKTPLLQ